ncbi:acetylcholinesterase-like [Brevipalpus obovatus]|uniref:acetylcholinesterase-like n=1 Tax=Brevipalpus obovatus TaxID=246614 RepID=UPI003D9FA295
MDHLNTISLTLFIGFLTLTHGGDDNSTPVIKTKSGSIVGYAEKYQGTKIYRFLGIPFAEPPVGKLRFSKPNPVKPWKNVLKATKKAKSCYQPRLSVARQFIRRELSEDCLYLNILATEDAVKRNGSKRPVMVFIHPTDFTYSSGSDYPFSSPTLVARKDVILVTMQFRMNIFGFLYSKKYPGMDGNIGLFDQKMALQWVNDNIEPFGGDSKRITLFGQESGGVSIADHIQSSEVKNLFQNAIIMSGPSFYSYQDQPNKRTSASTDIVIDRVKCSDAKDKLDCLRNVSPKDLISALPNRAFAFSPIFGDKYLPFQQSEVLRVSYFNDVNILMGYVRNDVGIFQATLEPEVYAKAELTLDDAAELIGRKFEKGAIDKLIKSYIGDPAKGPYSTRQIQKGLIRLANDHSVKCPIYGYISNAVARQDNGKTYVYELAHSPTTHYWPQCTMNSEFDVCSADDVLMIFGVPFDRPDMFSDKDRQVSDRMMEEWTSFARNGKPSYKGQKWPVWQSSNSTVLIDSGQRLRTDQKQGIICYQRNPYFAQELLPKLFPTDLYTIERQIEYDRTQSYNDWLYNTFRYLIDQNYF